MQMVVSCLFGLESQAGVEMVAPDMVTALAVRYLLAGLVVILIRGIVTDIIFSMMWKSRQGGGA